MLPVGMNFTPVCANGAASALSIAAPPAGSAGKNFKCFQPRFNARSTSVGVMTPGKNGIRFLLAAAKTVSFKPGETPNCAPASIARCTCSGDSSVPAPMDICGTLLADALDGFGGGGGAEGDFHDAQAAGEQRLGQRHGVVGAVQRRDAEEPLFEERFGIHKWSGDDTRVMAGDEMKFVVVLVQSKTKVEDEDEERVGFYFLIFAPLLR